MQNSPTAQCPLCPHQCRLSAGGRGNCGARVNRGGKIVSLTYGQICSLAVDPIEKKPLYHFYPGEKILSLGAWGCNLHCEFCQNWDISQQEAPAQNLSPAQAVALARRENVKMLAYTYNEPYVNFEYVCDCCAAARDAGLRNVLVTNGYYLPAPAEKLLALTDALNIDLKAFADDFYRRVCGGTLAPVLATIEQALRKNCHVEITTLLIDGENDAPAMLAREAEWLARYGGANLPTHLSAYFPRYRFTAPATTAANLQRAREIFAARLTHVYLGNLGGEQNTYCPHCQNLLVRRRGYQTAVVGLAAGACARCRAPSGIVTA
ncbi:AmmeMemoRadiSam system radical SAM enzyme [Planctomycetales bacterium]|nr:AmmeMemoRadiSam system radical SAM enzyme [Planctomycetales bacterium]